MRWGPCVCLIFFFHREWVELCSIPKTTWRRLINWSEREAESALLTRFESHYVFLMNHSGWIIVKQSFYTKLRVFTFSLFPCKYFTYPHEAMLYYALVQSGIDLKAPSAGNWQINLVFVLCFIFSFPTGPDRIWTNGKPLLGFPRSRCCSRYGDHGEGHRQWIPNGSCCHHSR